MPHSMTCHPQNDEAFSGKLFSWKWLSGPVFLPLPAGSSKYHLASKALISRKFLFLRMNESHQMLKHNFGKSPSSTITL